MNHRDLKTYIHARVIQQINSVDYFSVHFEDNSDIASPDNPACIHLIDRAFHFYTPYFKILTLPEINSVLAHEIAHFHQPKDFITKDREIAEVHADLLVIKFGGDYQTIKSARTKALIYNYLNIELEKHTIEKFQRLLKHYEDRYKRERY